jgi:spermidine synthase
MRTLHFNEQVVQSAMRLSAPDELVIPYTQAMAGFVSLHLAPTHILMIGLGGGSVTK